MADNIVQNEKVDRITLFALSANGEPVTGETINLYIRDLNSGEFWDGAAFAAAPTALTMVETDSVNWPGYYHYDFTTENREVVYKAVAPDGSDVDNDPFHGSAIFVPWIDDIITTRKYARNRVDRAGGRYAVYEDDQTTLFEAGDSTVNQRKPDNIP